MIYLKSLDDWLLHNEEYTQEDRDLIMRFTRDYFEKRKSVVDNDGNRIFPECIKGKDNIDAHFTHLAAETWKRIVVTRVLDEDKIPTIEYKIYDEISKEDEGFLLMWREIKKQSPFQ